MKVGTFGQFVRVTLCSVVVYFHISFLVYFLSPSLFWVEFSFESMLNVMDDMSSFVSLSLCVAV